MGQQMRIGVVRSHDIDRVIFSYYNGSYNVYGDTARLKTILPNEFVDIRYRANDKVELLFGVQSLGIFDSIQLKQTGKDYGLRLTPKSPNRHEKQYLDDFVIFGKRGHLTIVNLVQEHHYLAGVVESEGGGGKPLEYYKAQAVISRTYARDRLDRHRRDGFQLCDQVHCQAYHNRQKYTPSIDTAVLATVGEVMVDEDLHLVEGFFHANCGGQTTWTDYVWRNRIPYLAPIQDSFCIYTVQANYTTRVPKAQWRNYLVNQLGYPENDPVYGPLLYNFIQYDRQKYFQDESTGIKLTSLRYKFKLKSTFFSCYEDGDDVVIVGKGYGHGVGLCQEGAMEMAKRGFTYEQILKFYFSNIEVIGNYNEIFFTQENQQKDNELL
ncbi:stage II sporulation protein D [Lishizhenia tianjinensis]|uniref:Stage II sporulation protein D n=2 Tax=Lishizhenia tianjinensis TaxID=477690 RepID=A0A1I6XXX4_9FLAO|nr:stage II sporulation protein D [Lishizhenia tianjinensis]